MPTIAEWSNRSSDEIKDRISEVSSRRGKNARELARLNTALSVATEREAIEQAEARANHVTSPAQGRMKAKERRAMQQEAVGVA